MAWSEIWITLLTATLGSLGFSIIFYVKPQRLPLATLAGLLTCAIYLWCKTLTGGEFIPNLVAAFAGAVYAEIAARITKAPVPVYLIPSTIPLVPGGALYNTMSHFLSGAYIEAGKYGLIALQVAVGIAAGVIAASVVGLSLRSATQRLTHRTKGDKI